MKTTLSILTVSLVVGSAQAVDFVKEVLPILEESCMGCHREAYKDPKTGRNKKPKSGYRMDTAELIVGAGDENEKNIVPGEPDKSPVYTTTTLPEDDDYFMPPKGDPLTAAQKELLKQWIADGADFGEWTGTKFNPDGTKAE